MKNELHFFALMYWWDHKYPAFLRLLIDQSFSVQQPFWLIGR